MAGIDIWEILKRLREGGQTPSGLLSTQQQPEQAQEQEQPSVGLLGGFKSSLQPDAEKREALDSGLLRAGAAMMAAGGPSLDPTNFLQVLGKGVYAGSEGYDNYRKDASERALSGAKVRNDQTKLALGQAAAEAVSGNPGTGPVDPETGYSMAQLQQLHQAYLAAGELPAANSILDKIQRLQQAAAEKGLSVGADGNFEDRNGFNAGLAAQEAAKTTAQEEARKPFNTSTDITEYELYRKQEEDAGRVPQDYTPWSRDNKRAGATKVDVNGGGSDRQFFESMTEEAKIAKQAASGLNSMREARKAVEGNAILGAGADYRLGLQKIGAYFGLADTDAIVDTETFRSAIAPQVSAMLKMTVGTANISNSDREFAEKAAGGSIQLDQKSILRLIGIMEQANTKIVNGFNSKLDTIYPDGKGYDRERSLFKVDLPEPVAVEEKKSPTLLGGAQKASPELPSNDVVTVNSQEEYARLKKGTRFKLAIPGDPNNGRTGTK